MSTSMSAAQAVGEYLQSPDDLLKIAAFRKKLEKEKASIDAKLKSGVKDQLDATRDGLKKLLGTRDNVQTIKDEMATIDRRCRDPLIEVKTFDQISRVSMVHRNFAQTDDTVNNLLDLETKLQDLEAMIAVDSEDPLGPAPNLLSAHFQINQLASFRSQTMHQAESASGDARNILSRHFAELDTLIASFDQYITMLGKNVLSIVRAGNASVVVKLAKICEIERREDEKAIGIKFMKKVANKDAASKFKSMQAHARTLKYYRQTLMKNIAESIKETFSYELSKHKDDPGAFIDALDWVFEDLYWVETDVVPCFPPDYEIYSYYVKNYHKSLDETIQELVGWNPEATVLLMLHGWLKTYKKKMKDLEVPPELLEPPLMDGKEQALIDDYVKLIVSKLDEWTPNILKEEVRLFVVREEPPEPDADGLYGMQGPILFFQMLNQQVDAAAESGQGAVLARVVTEGSRVMKETQEKWTKILEAELKKQVDLKAEEVNGGLGEYVVALANDQIKSADYAEAMSARLEPLVSEKYKVVINDQLNGAIDGYLDVAKKCTQTLIDLIFNDIKPAAKQLFGPEWYNGIMKQIIETVRDYMGDYQVALNPAVLDLLVEDLLDMFLITYLTALANSSKLLMPAAADRIRDDVSEAFEFFSTLKPVDELENYFEVVEMVLALLSASKSLVFLSFWSFAKRHGPNLPFVEGLMKARDDLDRSAVNEVMESVRRKVKEENIVEPTEPTIMKKINVQSAFQRFLSK